MRAINVVRTLRVLGAGMAGVLLIPSSGIAQTIRGIAISPELQTTTATLDPSLVLRELEVRASSQSSPVIPPIRHHPADLNFDRTIGSTYYELQTNGSARRAIEVTPDGRVEVVWIMSQQQNSAFPDRGTGYAYFDGTTWVLDSPLTRLENTRTGWPSVVIAEGINRHVIISHNAGAGLNGLYQMVGTPVGDTAFVHRNLIFPNLILWPRIALAEDSIVYVIGLTDPNSVYQGASPHLLFSKGVIVGDTIRWDVVDFILPGVDSNRSSGFSVDGYAIDARDSIVAIGYFGELDDVLAIISRDYGQTWSVIPILDLPVDGYDPDGNILDVDGNGDADTVCLSDGTGWVTITPDGRVHVVFSYRCIVDDDPTPGNAGFSYFPLVTGLVYWNDAMPSFPAYLADTATTAGFYAPYLQFITDITTYDLMGNNNDTIDVVSFDSVIVGGWMIMGMPSMVSDGSELYLVWTMPKEDHKYIDGKQFWHIYMSKTCGGPPNFSLPVWVTVPYRDVGEEGGINCTFPAIQQPEIYDGKVRLVYLCDVDPAIGIYNDPALPVYAEVKYLELDTTLTGFAYISDYVTVHLWGIGSDTFWWEMGDGSVYTGQHVIHTFATDRDTTFTVTFHTRSPCGRDVTVTQTVPVTCGNVMASFTYTVGNDGLVVFINQSVDATTFFWDFGDGTTSTLRNPNHQYSAPGTYTVCLIADGYCIGHKDTFCTDVQITFTGIPEARSQRWVRVFPNPASSGMNYWIVTSQEPVYQVRLLDLEGRVLYDSGTECHCTYLTVPVPSQAGIYLMEIVDMEGMRIRETLHRQ